jgi:hypothetical protein
MADAEVYSWLFVSQIWDRLRRMPTTDKGFEESFRGYLYSKCNFNSISDVRDMGLGLSYVTLSDTSHELDVICAKGNELFVFEAKHYEASDLTKEIVFTFLGKVMDFYLKNAELLSNYKISMLLVTINRNVDDSIRKLCIAYGIKLIEPPHMTLKVMEYYLRDLYNITPEKESELKHKVEELIGKVSKLREYCDYSFSDIFRYKDKYVQVDLSLLEIKPTEALNEIQECYNLFEMVRQEWKSKRN